MPWVNSNVVDIVPTVYAGLKDIVVFYFMYVFRILREGSSKYSPFYRL